MSSYRDLTGATFGRLTVVSDHGRTRNGGVLWLCRCECGAETAVSAHNLVSGFTKSCGNHRPPPRQVPDPKEPREKTMDTPLCVLIPLQMARNLAALAGRDRSISHVVREALTAFISQNGQPPLSEIVEEGFDRLEQIVRQNTGAPDETASVEHETKVAARVMLGVVWRALGPQRAAELLGISHRVMASAVKAESLPRTFDAKATEQLYVLTRYVQLGLGREDVDAIEDALAEAGHQELDALALNSVSVP